MYYTVYKITNCIDGKIYIGVHKTYDLNDNYMGSGTRLSNAIKKHGIQSFVKEYLAIFDNPDDMYEMESSLVNADFISQDDTYNIKIGGYGGWAYVNENVLNEEKRKNGGHNLAKKFIDDPEFKAVVMNKIKDTKIARYGNNYNNTFKGKTHTEETKQKMSQKHKERLKDPTKNSQYGTMWITNGVENKKISKDSDIPEGWYKGRTQKQSVV